MSAPRLWQLISPARPSSICASPAPRKSRTIASSAEIVGTMISGAFKWAEFCPVGPIFGSDG